MKIGRLEIRVNRWTVIVGAIGLLWLAVSYRFFDTLDQWRFVRLWRQTCERDHGAWEENENFMRCDYPGGGSKAVIFRKPPL